MAPLVLGQLGEEHWQAGCACRQGGLRRPREALYASGNYAGVKQGDRMRLAAQRRIGRRGRWMGAGVARRWPGWVQCLSAEEIREGGKEGRGGAPMRGGVVARHSGAVIQHGGAVNLVWRHQAPGSGGAVR